MEDREPVYDELAERAVLGACLVDQDEMNWTSDVLSAEDFYVEANRTIWCSMIAIHKDGADVDAVSIQCELVRIGRWDSVGGAAYISTLLDVVPIHSRTEQYASRIVSCSRQRQTSDCAKRLCEVCRDPMAKEGDIEKRISDVRTTWERGTLELPYVDGDELLRKRFPRASSWLIDRWWVDRGCGIMAGDQKSHKTTLAVGMALSIATGTPWLGKWDVQRGRVVVVAEEDTEETIQRTERQMAEALSIHGSLRDFVLVPQAGVDLTSSRGRGRLGALVRKLKPSLLVIDPWRRVTPRVNENDSREVSEILGWVRNLQRETQCGTMILHHLRKEQSAERKQPQQGVKKVEDRIRGSSDFAAWYDSFIAVDRRSDDEHRIMAKHRSGPRLREQSVTITHDDDAGTLKIDCHEVEFVPRRRPSTPPQMEQTMDSDDSQMECF